VTIRALTAADRAALAGFTCARLGEAWADAGTTSTRIPVAWRSAAGGSKAPAAPSSPLPRPNAACRRPRPRLLRHPRRPRPTSRQLPGRLRVQRRRGRHSLETQPRHQNLPRHRRGAGLRPFRLHDLRHFMATQMLHAGIPPVTVSRRLDHRRFPPPSTTTPTPSPAATPTPPPPSGTSSRPRRAPTTSTRWSGGQPHLPDRAVPHAPTPAVVAA
jgi:Phage integrase family